MKSRNQREGKFIPGWCVNPAYHKASFAQVQAGDLTPKKRAGAKFDLKSTIDPYMGKVFYRAYREGAFE